MTGYTVHTGSNEDFSSGWDRIFGGAGEAAPKTEKAARKKAAAKKKARAGGKPAKRKSGRKKT